LGSRSNLTLDAENESGGARIQPWLTCINAELCSHEQVTLSLSFSLSLSLTHTHTSLAHHAEGFAARCLLLDRLIDVPAYSRACGKLPRISFCWRVGGADVNTRAHTHACVACCYV
jgi:hypothetical protein